MIRIKKEILLCIHVPQEDIQRINKLNLYIVFKKKNCKKSR